MWAKLAVWLTRWRNCGTLDDLLVCCEWFTLGHQLSHAHAHGSTGIDSNFQNALQSPRALIKPNAPSFAGSADQFGKIQPNMHRKAADLAYESCYVVTK